MSRLFGTDGIRGLAGVPPLDARTLRALGRAMARVLSADLEHPARMVVGRDTRESGTEILASLAAGLTHEGASVRSAGVVPTPAVSLLARGPHFDAGIVISASHNHHADNGLKLFSGRGSKLPDSLEAAIEAELPNCIEEAEDLSAGPPEDEDELKDRYLAWLAELAEGRREGLSHLKIAVDCANGAASRVAPELFEALGMDVTAIHHEPTGTNINEDCGSLHPGKLAEVVRERGADLGFAFDGDADRMLLVDRHGALIGGDQVLLICADSLIAQGKLKGGGLVGTVMSNYGLEQALHDRGLRLVRARVGDRFVAESMAAEGMNLGGEPSGHVIFSDQSPTGDGLLTALQVLVAMVESGKDAHELAPGFTPTPQLLVNVNIKARPPLDEIPGWSALAADWTERLAGTGRLLVRYSGTELLVRVMAEGSDEQLVNDCVRDCAGFLSRLLGQEKGATP